MLRPFVAVRPFRATRRNVDRGAEGSLIAAPVNADSIAEELQLSAICARIRSRAYCVAKLPSRFVWQSLLC